MKKTIKRLLGVALALVMCLTMAPATTAKADEAVALSEYSENQLLTAFMGEWEGADRGQYAILSRNHIKMWNDEYDKTVIDTDWTYDGVVELEGVVLTWEDFENVMSGNIQLEKVDGTWVDRDGNVYDEKDVTKTEGSIDGVYVDSVYEHVVYEDGVWKDEAGNIYEEENVALGDFYIGEVLVTSREDGLMAGSNGSVYQYIDGAWHEYLTDNVYERKDITPVSGIVSVSEGGWEKERAYVEYVDGAWKDDDGNVYVEEDLDYIYGEIEFNLDNKTKALKFTGGGYVVYLYVEYSEWVSERVLRVKYTNETTDHDGSMYLMVKNVSEDEQCYVDELLEASLTATETPVEEPKAEEPTTENPIEEPKTEEPTEAPAEEPKTEDTTTETPVEEPKTEEPTETPAVETEEKEIVEKTKDGRAVYTGETVYIVKKGDCLWNIAKQLLGNGARYKELFTRNNGIIEKAKLIFPGQEVIVPVK